MSETLQKIGVELGLRSNSTKYWMKMRARVGAYVLVLTRWRLQE